MKSLLSDYPCSQLKLMIAKMGHAICEHPNRCETILRKLCPKHKREVDLLIAALNEKIPQKLLHYSSEVSAKLSFKELSQQLQDNLFMAESFADWAVASWALALNISEPLLSPPTPELTPTALPATSSANSLDSPPIKNPTPSLSLIPLQQRIGRFIVQDNGIATDTKTGLIWCRFACGQTWQDGTATGHAKRVNWRIAFDVMADFNRQGGYAGFTDWRLPATDELKTLLDKVKGKRGHYIDNTVFVFDSLEFWCIFPSTHGNRNAWIVNFGSGNDNYGGEYNRYAILPVRGINRASAF
jgi:Protein of unknown function (DUF1566)